MHDSCHAPARLHISYHLYAVLTSLASYSLAIATSIGNARSSHDEMHKFIVCLVRCSSKFIPMVRSGPVGKLSTTAWNGLNK